MYSSMIILIFFCDDYRCCLTVAEEEEEDQDDEAWDRPKKQTKRRVGRRSIFEIYEPSELESSHMTDQDNEIRSTDMPERFQVCNKT